MGPSEQQGVGEGVWVKVWVRVWATRARLEPAPLSNTELSSVSGPMLRSRNGCGFGCRFLPRVRHLRCDPSEALPPKL